MFGVVICPMVFYIPKFFELKTVYSPYSIRTVVDCASIIQPPPEAGDLTGERVADFLCRRKCLGGASTLIFLESAK